MKILLIFLFSFTNLYAQTNNPNQSQDQNGNNESNNENVSDELNQKRRWDAQLPGGSYSVALARIGAISKHTYLIDGAIQVTEVNVDTGGGALVRFYYLEPVGENSQLNSVKKLSSRPRELLDKAVGQATGLDISQMVQKNYPTTTHARTIEYRVKNLTELTALHDSIFRAWDTGRGRSFSIK